MSGGIEPLEKIDQIRFRHGGATNGGRRRIPPDMDEDAGAGTGNRRRIVIDEQSPFIEIVFPTHLFGAAPIDSCDLRSFDELVVVARVRIIDTLGLFRERHVFQPNPARAVSRRIPEGRAETKNTRWNFVVALFFWGAVAIRRNQSDSPGQALFTEDDRR